MKSLIKALTFVTMAAWCGTALADYIVDPTGWAFGSNYRAGQYATAANGGGLVEYYPSAMSVIPTNGAVGTGNTEVRVNFNPLTLGEGESITFSGDLVLQNYATGTGGLGGGGFRIGLMNDNGYSGADPNASPTYGVLSNNQWPTYNGGNSAGSSIYGFTGYMLMLPTGGTPAPGGVAGGNGGYPENWITGNPGNSSALLYADMNMGSGNGAWLSGYGSHYGLFGNPSNEPTNNVSVGQTLFFSIKVTRAGGVGWIEYKAIVIDPNTGLPLKDSGGVNDVYNLQGSGEDQGGGATMINSTNGGFTYDAVGFYLGASGTTANEFDFSNLQVDYVPEPVSMALVGFGILTGSLFIRRRKS